jgi:hypothetical protein
MRTRFAVAVLVATLFGAGPLFSATTFAQADAGDRAQLSQKIVVEPEPGVRVIEAEPDLRIIQSEPEVRVKIEEPGHYERQRVLVREGYYETYNMWVPKERKGFLGLKKIPGHYEARQRWVAPQYEYRDVWVSHR